MNYFNKIWILVFIVNCSQFIKSESNMAFNKSGNIYPRNIIQTSCKPDNEFNVNLWKDPRFFSNRDTDPIVITEGSKFLDKESNVFSLEGYHEKYFPLTVTHLVGKKYKCDFDKLENKHPILISLSLSNPNSAGGVNSISSIYNLKGPIIKYIFIDLEFYNKVGDLVEDEIRKNKLFSIKITGPINKNDNKNYISENTIYNFNAYCVKVKDVQIEYIGDSEKISFKMSQNKNILLDSDNLCNF